MNQNLKNNLKTACEIAGCAFTIAIFAVTMFIGCFAFD